MISPSSIGWMPATHLISVDLPAPLSPTSAMTSPARTSKSTSVSACTEPKFFDTPRSSRRGAVEDVGDGVIVMSVWVRAGGRPLVRAAPESMFLAYVDQQYFLYSPTQTSLFFRYPLKSCL